MAKLPKGFLNLLNSFKTLMLQRNETMEQHDEARRILGQITNGLGVMGTALNKGSTKVVIRARIHEFLHSEKDKNKDSVAMVTPNIGIFGNPTP
jgi:hypothetical protein